MYIFSYKFFFKLGIGCIFLFLVCSQFVFAQTESIDTYDIDIQIQRNGSIGVAEKIVYDFGSNQRHGIFRDIPWRYPLENEQLITEISIESVTDENGIPYRYTVSTEGDFIRAKIGDPDRTISGIQTYVITYTVMGILTAFEEHDELYWNAIGTGWEIPINRAGVTVVLPQNTELKGQCFIGTLGSQESSCDISIEADRVSFNTLRRLSANEAFTVVVGWPKGLVTVPPPKTTSGESGVFLSSSYAFALSLVLPVFVFGVMFILWFRYGRDPSGRGTIVPEYTPPNDISPGMAGVIADQRASVSEISAMIIGLAVSGFIKIKRVEKPKLVFFKGVDYELEKQKDFSGIKDAAEKLLAEKLFEKGISGVVALSELKRKFVKESKDVLDTLYANAATKGYFPQNPNMVRGIYMGIGIVLLILGSILGGILGMFTISLIVSGAIIIVFGFFMPRRSKAGRLAYEHILGFKEFLKVTEKDRLKFHNAPEKTPELFSMFLPYAMVLGIYEEWVDQFKDITMPEPQWYDGGGAVWNAVLFSSTLHDFSSGITAMSQASRGGSGFSGGGGGGGGGGSW